MSYNNATDISQALCTFDNCVRQGLASGNIRDVMASIGNKDLVSKNVL